MAFSQMDNPADQERQLLTPQPKFTWDNRANLDHAPIPTIDLIDCEQEAASG